MAARLDHVRMSRNSNWGPASPSSDSQGGYHFLDSGRTLESSSNDVSRHDMASAADCDMLDDGESGGVSLVGTDETVRPGSHLEGQHAHYTRNYLHQSLAGPSVYSGPSIHADRGGVVLPSDYCPTPELSHSNNVAPDTQFTSDEPTGRGSINMVSTTSDEHAESHSFSPGILSLHAAIPEPVFHASSLYNPFTTGLNITPRPENFFNRFESSSSQAHVTPSGTLAIVPPPETQATGPEDHSRTSRRNSNNETSHQHAEPQDVRDHVPDVMGFLERWDMQTEMPGAGLVRLDSHRIRDWRPPSDDFVGQSLNTSRDMQMLDWQSLDTDRKSARVARKLLYPRKDAYSHAGFSSSQTAARLEAYTFKRSYGDHRAIFMHYQLRHVLAATTRNDVFYAAYNKVIRTSLACPSVKDVVVNLSTTSQSLNRATVDCHITTIAVSPASEFTGYSSDSVLVTGGFEGEYSLLNLNSHSGDLPTEGFVTNAMDGITTHVHTVRARRTGALAAAFCSNDRKLRLLDISTNKWTNTFEYPDHLNCAATSPDGRLRVVVGDTKETLITDAERGTVLFSTAQHDDDAFACAWAEDGWHVATGAQDGKVVVYDARNWAAPVATLVCEMGCARSLVFTGAGDAAAGSSLSSALVVAEADDIVSVYDTRNWAVEKQTIDFFGSVAGVAALDGGRELVVANGDRTVGGLMLFERNDDSGFVHFEEADDTDDDSWARRARRGAVRSRKRREAGKMSSHREDGAMSRGFELGLDQLLI